jgi:small-conductance mechanosensitive channel
MNAENTTAAIIALAASLIAGLVIDQALFYYVRSRAQRTESSTGLQFAVGLHGMPTAIGFVAGVWLGVSRLGLTGSAAKWAEKGPRVLGILVITAFSARLLGRVVRAFTARESTAMPSGSIFTNLARTAVWVVGALSLLATLGISVTPLVTALGVGGLAVGLALQPTLENVFSGLQLLGGHHVQPGDYIKLQTGEEGKVLDVTWRHTAVLQASNDVVLVPNSVLSRATVTNYSALDVEHVLSVPVMCPSGWPPDEALAAALEVARQVAAEAPGAARGAEPTVAFSDYSGDRPVMSVSIRCRSYQDRGAVRHLLISRLAKRFAEKS